jgi:hypothetical protein
MRVYTLDELRRFLEGVDAALLGKALVVVIGGGAAAIEYGAQAARATSIPGRGFRRTFSSAISDSVRTSVLRSGLHA